MNVRSPPACPKARTEEESTAISTARLLPTAPPSHECDLFLLSSRGAHRAPHALRHFALRGAANHDGWGLGAFRDGRATVLRSHRPATQAQATTAEFAAAAAASESPVLLGHLRWASCAAVRPENNHPFQLHFLGRDWLFAHNGTASRRDLVPAERRLLPESDVDSARVFELVREAMIAHLDERPSRSVVGAVRHAFRSLLAADPDGTFNLLLSNGDETFVLVHHRRFWVTRREKEPAGVLLLSTLRLTEGERWTPIACRPEPRLLVVSGDRLLLNDRLGPPRGRSRAEG